MNEYTIKAMKFFILIFLLLSKVSASELNSEETISKVSVSTLLTFSSLSLSTTGKSLTGPGLEAYIQYSLSSKWATGASFRQMSLGTGGSGSALNFKVTYALLGSLEKSFRETTLGHKKIIINKELEESCLCVQFLASQYYLNTTNNTVPFTGFGIAGFYKYPTRKFSSLIGGLSFESLQNKGNLTVISLFFGLNFRI